MDTRYPHSGQKMTRYNLRNFYLTATLEQLREALGTYRNSFVKECIQEMIEKCLEQGVDSYGETY